MDGINFHYFYIYVIGLMAQSSFEYVQNTIDYGMQKPKLLAESIIGDFFLVFNFSNYMFKCQFSKWYL